MTVCRSAQAPCNRSILGLLRWVAMTMAGLSLGFATASAEEKWQATISTTAGDDVVRRVVAPAAPLPQWNDPRYRRPTPVANPYKVAPRREAWTPVITGAGPATADKGHETPTARARIAQNTSPGVQKSSPGGPSAANGAQVAAPAQQQVPAEPRAQTAPSPGGAERSAAQPRQGPLEALPPDATAAQQYCFNTADTAADARFAWQAKKIKELEAELEKRAAELEAKTEEYKRWLARRDEFSRKAQEKLVEFYAKMRPDAAASHMVAMDDETAAALLTKLEPKVASVVMAEITPEKAAKIAAIISGAAKIPRVRRPKPRTEERAKPAEDGNAATPPSRTKS